MAITKTIIITTIIITTTMITIVMIGVVRFCVRCLLGFIRFFLGSARFLQVLHRFS